MINVVSKLLCSFADWSWWLEAGITSMVLFGEEPYPQKEDY